MKKILKNLGEEFDPVVGFPFGWKIHLSEYEEMLTYFVQRTMKKYTRDNHAN